MAPMKRKAADSGGTSRPQSTMTRTSNARVTRGMAAEAPRQAVFNTAELLEEISMHFPATSIFALQRVCRQFRDIVRSSARIQQKLFLRVSSTKRLTWSIETWGETRSVSYKQGRRHTEDAKYIMYEASTALEAAKLRFMPARLSPLLRKSPSYNSGNTALSTYYQGASVRVSLEFSKGLSGPASWKKTYLTDPPCQRAQVSMSWSLKGKPRGTSRGSTWVELSKPGGLTLGDLVDAALQEKSDDASFKVGSKLKHYGGTVGNSILGLESECRSQACIDTGYTYITLYDIALPNEHEWKAMK